MRKIMNRIVKFLDNHRFILILLILLFISCLFLSIKSVIFLNHKFKSYRCTESLDETYCYHEGIQIYINPEKEKKNIFKEKKSAIESLQKKYALPEFNYYTSYFYEVASLLNFNETGENEELLVFFKNYNTSYNIGNFYKENTIYYDIFYHYKLNLK